MCFHMQKLVSPQKIAGLHFALEWERGNGSVAEHLFSADVTFSFAGVFSQKIKQQGM